MKHFSLAVAVAVLLSFTGPSAWGVALYTVTDLGTLPGGPVSSAYGINENGQVVGTAEKSSGINHAFLYSNATMTDLGAGWASGTNGMGMSSASGINDSGQVVGGYFPDTSGDEHAFLYSNGTMTDLGSMLPGGSSSVATGINNSGQVVGGVLTSGNQPLPRVPLQQWDDD